MVKPDRVGRRRRSVLRVTVFGILLGLGQHAAPHRVVAAQQGGAVDRSDPPADHVVLVTIDGLRPEFYLEAGAWPAPMIQRMAREGAHARAVRGVTPTVTYPSHTTIVTGALPARHGIYHNRPFEPAGQTGRWYMESAEIEVPAIWDAVRAAGKRSAAISWPVSAGAPIDWNIPEFWSVSGSENGLRGPAAHVAALRSRVTPAGLLEEIERESLGAFPDFYWGRNLSREDAVGAMAGHLIERYQPALLLVHLNQTDYHQHAYGREDPRVELSVAAVDRAIARMVDAAARAGTLERTAFIVTGDHGFIDIHTSVSPNVWLVEAGLLEDSPDRGDWRAAFHPAGGSAFLRLRNPRDRAAVNRVKRILGDLPPGVRNFFRVVEGEELRRLRADPESPLALAAAPGIYIDGATSGDPIGARSGAAHGYFPEHDAIHTGFVAWGAGVAEGRVIHEMGLVDVAPTIAALLGIDFDAPDGAFRPGILRGR